MQCGICVAPLCWICSTAVHPPIAQACVRALRFCVEFLLGPALELAEDVTPTVRLRAAGLLPALKRAVRLPDDLATLEGLNSALAKLQVGCCALM